jgi:hypothetical protein
MWGRIIETQYSETQALLDRRWIVAYRGVGRRTQAGSGNVHPQLRPLSAFSLDRETARVFAREAIGRHGPHGVLIEAAIPPERVLTTPATGLASFDEKEVIVLGSDGATQDVVREHVV